MDTHATIEVMLETEFSNRSVQRGCKEDNWGNPVSSVRKSVRKRVGWKGAAIQRGFEFVKLLEAVTRERLLKTQQAG
jgi:hypothetical protein